MDIEQIKAILQNPQDYKPTARLEAVRLAVVVLDSLCTKSTPTAENLLKERNKK